MQRIIFTLFLIQISGFCYARTTGPSFENFVETLPLIILGVPLVAIFWWYGKIYEDGTLDKAVDKANKSIKEGTKKVVKVAKAIKDYPNDCITNAKLEKEKRELEVELLRKQIQHLEQELKKKN